MEYNEAITGGTRRKASIAPEGLSHATPRATGARAVSSTPLAAGDEVAWAQRRPGQKNDDSDGTEVEYEKRTNVMEVDERRRQLEADEWAAEVEPKRVLCRGCKRWIKLDGRSLYYRGFWDKHRALCRAIKRILGVPIPKVKPQLYFAELGPKAELKARGTIPIQSTAMASRGTKTSHTPGATKPTTQPRAQADAGGPENASQEAISHAHEVRGVPIVPRDHYSTRAGKARGDSDVFDAASAQPPSPHSAPPGSAVRAHLPSKTYVASVTKNRQLSSLAEDRTTVMVDHGINRTLGSRGVGRLDIEEHPVMGRRIVPRSGRNDRIVVDRERLRVEDGRTDLVDPELGAQPPTAPDCDRRATPASAGTDVLYHRTTDAACTTQPYVRECLDHRTPDWIEKGERPAVPGGPEWEQHSPTELGGPALRPESSTDQRRPSSRMPPSYGYEPYGPEDSSTSRQDIERREIRDGRRNGVVATPSSPWNKAPHVELPDRRSLPVRILATPEQCVGGPYPTKTSPTFREEFTMGGSRATQRYTESTGTPKHGDPLTVIPRSRISERRGSSSLSTMTQPCAERGSSPIRGEDAEFPAVPTPPWANIAQINLVDPGLPVQLYQQPAKVVEGGLWIDDDEDDDEEDHEVEDDGVFAPGRRDSCSTIPCHHRFRFSYQSELHTYFDGATIESMAKYIVDPDILHGVRCLASLASNMSHGK
ncbi:hypothetical protein LshimejAT787_1800190 [Lyophyllum shimeji]|uniref:Uncharacterized protein n=1 Tax=Lyophyllum shimeji TaxID=47721 RepID=A0A9P3UTZ6_LYOSH|nr:hypothetical protein LshimejAT787_1800190 [Lyophyllum shimeji]